MTGKINIRTGLPISCASGGWALSVPLQVAELEAMAASTRRARNRAIVAGAVLVPVGLAVTRVDPALGAVVAAVAAERIVRASWHRHTARTFEIEAMVRQL